MISALVLDAVARDQLGDRVTAERDIERGLDLAEPDSLVFPFVVVAGTGPPRAASAAPHGARRPAGRPPQRPRAGRRSQPVAAESAALPEPLSESELRVLRFLPSNLSASEIAGQLYVSTSTVKTHMRHIYEKLDAHRRTEAVDRARELGLLGPSARSGR